MLKSTRLITAALAAAALAAPLAASAQSASLTQKKVGPFNIDYVTEGGKFDRCAATMWPGKLMLRIAYTKTLQYSISVPGTPTPARTLDFHFGGESFSTPASTDPARARAWGPASSYAMNALMTVTDAINITYGAKEYSWPIGRTDMGQVIGALDDCTRKALGR